MADPIRVFFAHSKGTPDDEIDRWSGELRKAFATEGFDPVEVVPGRDDYMRYAAGAGGFSAWAKEVPVRRDMAKGGRYYDVIVSLNARVGRATADICTVALASGVPVILMEVDPATDALVPKPVTQVVVEDPRDYIKGWWLDT